MQMQLGHEEVKPKISHFKLRDYQEDAIAQIFASWAKGHKAVLGVAATGAGKTVIFIELARRILAAQGKRVVILAHRQELIYQPKQRAEDMGNFPFSIGIVMGKEREYSAQIVVGTVQTISRPKTLQKILWHGKIDLLIIDEAHHSTADTYVRVINQLTEANPDLLVYGCTATPIRADGIGLREIFTHVAFRYTILELVPKYLAPPKWQLFFTGVELADVKITAGDFNKQQLTDVWESDHLWHLAVDKQDKYAADMKTICFTVSVKGAHRLAEIYRERGYTAIAIDGNTPNDERVRILRAYGRGEYQIITNCGVLTEGFDDPSIMCAQMLRPTKSDGLYTQMFGRAARLFPGKEFFLVLDYAPEDKRNCAMLGDILGVPRETLVKMRRKDTGEDMLSLTFMGGGQFQDADGNEIDQSQEDDGGPIQVVGIEYDYLKASPWRWKNVQNFLSLDLGENYQGIQSILVITPPGRDYFELYELTKAKQDYTWACVKISEAHAFETVSQEAEDIAGERAIPALAGKNARWLNDPVTVNQINFIKRLANGHLPMSHSQLYNLTKGEAGELITSLQVMQVLKKHGVYDG